ncbi:MAG: hypothetical protein PWP27_2678 [Clostridiales bacterium]|jgi:hypothetical protein|nr:hypothetical protein [Clostridiales bacterium]
MEKKLTLKRLNDNYQDYISDWKIAQMIKPEEYTKLHQPSNANIYVHKQEKKNYF